MKRGRGKSSSQLIYWYSNSMNLFIPIYLYSRLFSSLSLISVPNVLCFLRACVCVCGPVLGKTAESNRVLLLLLVLLLFLFIVVVVCAAGFKVNNDVKIDHENVAKNPIELKEGGEGRCAICASH